MEAADDHGTDESVNQAGVNQAGVTEAPGEALCRLDEIADPGSKGFERDDGSIFIVRRGNEVSGYINSCPHTRGPLDWIEGQFLDLVRQHIVCATHGALFRIGDGHCIAGPCAGEDLTRVPLTLRDGVIYLAGY